MTVYQRFDPAKGYIALQFHADRVAQSAEMNDWQEASAYHARRISDVLFADGDITDGARCTVDADTGECRLEAGDVYIAGYLHRVEAAVLTVPTSGIVVVGLDYVKRTVTALEDPTLYNPAIGTAGYGEPGADRVQVLTSWTMAGQGQGDFYPVWTIEDGHVKPREATQQDAAFARAIERYDVESTGSDYAVNGLGVVQLPDEGGAQVYTVAAGAARINGKALELPFDRRLVYAAQANMAQVSSEPHGVDTDALQHFTFDRWPVLQPATARVQRRKTETLTHGSFVGAADPIPDSSVVRINSVVQGGTTYTVDVDYKLTAGQVDWSLGGAEPVPGSSYEATYEYISTEPVLNQTPRGFDVLGALPGTLVLVDYEYALRRIDRIVLGADGAIGVIKGVPATWQPVAPAVPAGMLALASIFQTWEDTTRTTTVDSVRVVPMQTLVAYSLRMDEIEMDLAELRLATDVNGRYGGLKKGYFADPMRDDSMRDQGLAQTALIAGGALQLHEGQAATLLGDGKTPHALDYTLAPRLVQSAYSRAMPISESAGELPASVTLAPAVDRWEVPGVRVYPKTVRISNVAKGETYGSTAQSMLDPALIDTSDITLREITVQFSIKGFRPLEALQELMFAGVVISLASVTGTKVANAQGVLEGGFTVPAGIPVGAKAVQFKGASGSVGQASYTGSAAITVRVAYFANIFRVGYHAGSTQVTYVV